MIKTYKKITESEENRLVIYNDDNNESPRGWDNLGYFIAIDNNYRSPDNNPVMVQIVKDAGQIAESCADHMQIIRKEVKNQTGEIVKEIYPVCKYEHSGVSYSLGRTIGFDYSNNGFYIVTDKTAKVTGVKPKDYRKIIEGEIDIYNKWANGEVYGFILYDEAGEMVDSCGGFYNLDDIKSQLPEEWQGEDLAQYFKN